MIEKDKVTLIWKGNKIPGDDCKVIFKTNLVKNLQLKYLGSFKYLITIYGIIKKVLNEVNYSIYIFSRLCKRL